MCALHLQIISVCKYYFFHVCMPCFSLSFLYVYSNSTLLLIEELKGTEMSLSFAVMCISTTFGVWNYYKPF